MNPETSAKRRQEIFDKQLREVTKQVSNEVTQEKNLRPFLCEGSPLDCPIFLVGINPSKTAPFWPRWNAMTGCDKQGWFEDYLRINGRCSPTRLRIERLVKAIAPIRCLETNIFTELSGNEPALIHRDTRVFDFLLKTVRPRVVFVHGKSGARHLSQLTNTPITFQPLTQPDYPLDQYDEVEYDDFTFNVIAGPHLSRGWSYERVEALGSSLRDTLSPNSV